MLRIGSLELGERGDWQSAIEILKLSCHVGWISPGKESLENGRDRCHLKCGSVRKRLKSISDEENIEQRGVMGAKRGRTFDGGVIYSINNCQQNLQ